VAPSIQAGVGAAQRMRISLVAIWCEHREALGFRARSPPPGYVEVASNTG